MQPTQKQNKEAVLEVKGLHTYFEKNNKEIKVIEGLSFNLYKGEILGIVGESGCGKSLTALSILNILPKGAKIKKGEIIFKGKNLLKLNEKEMQNIRGKNISIIFQEPSIYLNPVLTVGYQVAEAYAVHNKTTIKKSMEKVIELFKEVGLPDPKKRIHNYPHELSGGQKQRIMIAMALINNPEIIIADEPTTALDVTVQAQIVDLLKNLQKKYHTSIIFITHDLPLITEIADRIMVMYAGMKFEETNTENLINSPLHPYTEKLLKSIPEESSKWEKMPTIKGVVPNPANKPKGCPFHPRCEYAVEDCKDKIPKLIEAKKGHFTSCFYWRKLNGKQ